MIIIVTVVLCVVVGLRILPRLCQTNKHPCHCHRTKPLTATTALAKPESLTASVLKPPPPTQPPHTVPCDNKVNLSLRYRPHPETSRTKSLSLTAPLP